MLEGFWIRNFKSLKQVGLGTSFRQFVYVEDDTDLLPYSLDVVTLLAGPNGTGKSSVIDAFTFLSDCFRHGVDYACLKRGGFDAIYSHGGKGTLSFGFHYRQDGETEPATYALSIDRARNGVPFVESELLAYRRGKESIPVIFLQNGVKSIRYLAPDPRLRHEDLTKIEFTDHGHLGLAALQDHPRFPVLASFRDLFENCVLSDFTSDPARGLDVSLPRRHESSRGVSLSGLVRYVIHRYGVEVENLFRRIAQHLPGVEAILPDFSDEEKPRLSFKLFDAQEPIPMTLLSDATIRLFAYSLLLEEDQAAPMILFEEPENGLDRMNRWVLKEQIQRLVDFPRAKSQLMMTSHHAELADGLHPSLVWLFAKDQHGFTVVERASDVVTLDEVVAPDQAISSTWFSERFEDKM